jgi:hypothetical protein
MIKFYCRLDSASWSRLDESFDKQSIAKSEPPETSDLHKVHSHKTKYFKICFTFNASIITLHIFNLSVYLSY